MIHFGCGSAVRGLCTGALYGGFRGSRQFTVTARSSPDSATFEVARPMPVEQRESPTGRIPIGRMMWGQNHEDLVRPRRSSPAD